MKKVLVLHYSQTGQLTQIVDSVITPLKTDQIEIVYVRIKPKIDFPFPWSAREFFEAFPESVEELPVELEELQFDTKINYDLIILGYQPWYLSPSIPTSSLLKSEAFKTVAKNCPIITIIGCRNMWLMAQEKLKVQLVNIQAKLIGNIVLRDKAMNLISVYTILRWMLWGKKGNSGVAQTEIKDAKKFGEEIKSRLMDGKLERLQNSLLEQGAVEVQPNLIALELRASKIFSIWSKMIIAKDKGSAARRGLLRVFSVYLAVGIFVLSPLTTVIHYITLPFVKKRLRKQVGYYSQL